VASAGTIPISDQPSSPKDTHCRENLELALRFLKFRSLVRRHAREPPGGEDDLRMSADAISRKWRINCLLQLTPADFYLAPDRPRMELPLFLAGSGCIVTRGGRRSICDEDDHWPGCNQVEGDQ
jgi:hypothetical protein